MVMLLGPTKNAGVTKTMPKTEDTQRSEEEIQGDGDGQVAAPAGNEEPHLEKKSQKRKRGFRKDDDVAKADTPRSRSYWGRGSTDATRKAIRARAARSAARYWSKPRATGG